MVAVEKAVAVVMQESGRRALFDATQRLGANYREKAGLINSSLPGNARRICLSIKIIEWEARPTGLLIIIIIIIVIVIIVIIIIMNYGANNFIGIC